MAHAVDADLNALVYQPVVVHARADAGFVKQVDGDLLDDAGADAAKHVFAGLPLHDDVVDAVACARSWPSSRPAGPAPMMATWVRMFCISTGRRL